RRGTRGCRPAARCRRDPGADAPPPRRDAGAGRTRVLGLPRPRRETATAARAALARMGVSAAARKRSDATNLRRATARRAAYPPRRGARHPGFQRPRVAPGSADRVLAE